MNAAALKSESTELRPFKPYASYKNSGVAWLGEIPSHWAIRRLKTIAAVQLSNVDKKSLEGQEAVRLCNYTDVSIAASLRPCMAASFEPPLPWASWL